MRKQLQQVFFLVFPFLWKDKATRLATISTLGIVLLNTLAQTITPWLFGYLLKHYQTLKSTSLLLTVTFLLLCWYAHRTLGHLRAIVFFPVINRAIRDIRMRVVIKLHQAPLQSWERYGITEILSASTRVSQSIRSFMGVSFVNILPALFKIGAFSVAMFHVHRSTWYFSPLVVLIYVYVYFGIRNFLAFRRHCWEATDQVRTAITDSLHNTKFSRFHLEEENIRLSAYFDAEEKSWLHNNFLQHKIPLVQVTWVTLIRGGLVMHLVLLLRAGELSWADFVVIERYTSFVYVQLANITSHLRILLSSVIDLQKVLDLLALPTHAADASLPPLPLTFTPTSPILQVNNVSFAYAQHGTAILKGCSLNIYQGDKLVITGPSGVGKSTLCHLLAGIHQPQQGEVLLWGMPMQQLSLATIGQYVYFVDQEAALISGTIADNLKSEKVQQAPLAYLKDRLHDPSGKKLSGGEKQRIFLARCLSYQPQVLILDETLSALDDASAQELLQLVLVSVPTVILVTHRQSLVQGFKRIYRLEAGQLKEV
jgi:ABC-type branched-subunit amino acid transport system ATPase component